MQEEQSLIRKVQKHGNHAAADALVRKYYDEIFRFIRKQIQNEVEALDITQETFIGLLRTIQHYDAASASFRTWLYKIATNKLIDYYRSRSNKILFEPLILEDIEPIDENDFTQQIQDSMVAEKICEYVGQLSPDIQKIFRLHIWGEYTFKEIANIMALPESSVKSKYYKLVKLLRKGFHFMDNTQKEASIEFILSQGLSKPKSMSALVSEMFQSLGFRFIFWDTSYSLLFAALTVIPILIMLVLVPPYFRFTAAVLVAPTLFLLILAFAETAERLGGLYEIKQTCYYTIRQVTALRIMCYSTIGMLYSTGIALFSMENMLEFLALFTLCLSSLLICAILTLVAMRYISMKWTGIVCAAVWAMINLATPFLFGKEWEDFLKVCYGHRVACLGIKKNVDGGQILCYRLIM